MDFFRHRSFRFLCALFAFLMFTGDIVADAIHDASGACVTESQDSGHDSCPACGCTVHNGTAAAPEAVALLAVPPEASESVPSEDDQPAIAAGPAIDHPPQLA